MFGKSRKIDMNTQLIDNLNDKVTLLKEMVYDLTKKVTLLEQQIDLKNKNQERPPIAGESDYHYGFMSIAPQESAERSPIADENPQRVHFS